MHGIPEALEVNRLDGLRGESLHLCHCRWSAEHPREGADGDAEVGCSSGIVRIVDEPSFKLKGQTEAGLEITDCHAVLPIVAYRGRGPVFAARGSYVLGPV